jgi:iron complex outermembrane receptor protein
MKIRLTPIWSAALATISTAAFSQQERGPAAPATSSQPPTPYTVVVRGSRPTSLPTQIPTTIEGVTRDEIERTVNATDAEDALKYLPSLLVRKRYIGDYNHAVLSTRASGTGNSARSMVYADGILLSNYLGNGAAFAPRWGMVSPEEIERVDVLYGPFSAVYGGNSVGAVVDYVTRMPTRFEAHAKIVASRQHFSLYGSSDSYSGKQTSVSLGNRVGKWSWFVDVSRNDSEGQPLTFPTKAPSTVTAGSNAVPVTGAVPGLDRSNRDWLILGTGTQYQTIQDHLKAKIAYDFTPHIRASYTFGWWKNNAQGRPTSFLRNAAGQQVYSGPVNIAGRSYQLGDTDFSLSNEALEHYMHGLSVKSNTKGVFDWEVAASLYDYGKDVLRAPTIALPAAAAGGPGRIVNQGGTGWNTFAAKGVWRPANAGGKHIVEFGYQREAYKLASIEHATSDWIDGAPALLPNAAFGGRTETNSLYAQDTWKFAPRWKTVLGARLEHWSATGGRTSKGAITAAHPDRSEHHVSPKAALAWQASDDWTFKASLGRAVRMPTVSELYQGGINAQGVLSNNDPNLKPEKSWTGELTAERKLASGSLRLTAFGERTRDALYSQINVLTNVMTIQNVDRIDTKGLEAAFSASDVLLPGVDLNTSVTWTDSKIERNDRFRASVGKWQPRIPKWRASGVATYRASDKLAVTFAARYSGRQYSTLDNSDPNGFAYQGASKYFTTDLRATYRIDKQWSVAFGIDNLNNYKYWNFHPYPQRTLVAELKFDL